MTVCVGPCRCWYLVLLVVEGVSAYLGVEEVEAVAKRWVQRRGLVHLWWLRRYRICAYVRFAKHTVACARGCPPLRLFATLLLRLLLKFEVADLAPGTWLLLELLRFDRILTDEVRRSNSRYHFCVFAESARITGPDSYLLPYRV